MSSAGGSKEWRILVKLANERSSERPPAYRHCGTRASVGFGANVKPWPAKGDAKTTSWFEFLKYVWAHRNSKEALSVEKLEKHKHLQEFLCEFPGTRAIIKAHLSQIIESVKNNKFEVVGLMTILHIEC